MDYSTALFIGKDFFEITRKEGIACTPLQNSSGGISATWAHISLLLTRLMSVKRFAGATDWTVLQHTAMMAEMAKALGASEQELLAIWVHDLHEALIGDIPTPVKRLVGYEEFKKVEDALQVQMMFLILQAAGSTSRELGVHAEGLVQKHHDYVKALDKRAVLEEASRFLPQDQAERVRIGEESEDETDRKAVQSRRIIQRLSQVYLVSQALQDIKTLAASIVAYEEAR